MYSYTLEYAAAMLDIALLKRRLDELCSEQRKALEEPRQCFAMLADFEARIGLDVGMARRVLAEWHAKSPRRFGGWQHGDEGRTRDGSSIYRVTRIDSDGYIQVDIEDPDGRVRHVIGHPNGKVGSHGDYDLMAPVARLEQAT